MHETTLNIIGINFVLSQDPDESSLRVAFVTGMPLPIPGPDGGPLQVPSGQYLIPLNKDMAIQLADRLREEAEKLPDEKPKSDIQVAQSLQGVDRLAALNKDLR